jgi:hypothetical protein
MFDCKCKKSFFLSTRSKNTKTSLWQLVPVVPIAEMYDIVVLLHTPTDANVGV